MKRMNTLDAAWLAVESEDTPMHVGTLQIYSLPADATPTFLHDFVARLKAGRDFAPPWNHKLLNPGKLGRLLTPAWKTDNDMDLDYHVRHSALPKPGGERELGILISRLHSHPLDFTRPLWEAHIIEGLENNRFALYVKMHHALIDGISGVRLMQRVLSNDPEARNMRPPWTVRPERVKLISKSVSTETSAVEALQNQIKATPQLASALSKVFRRQDESGLSGPFAGPTSVLNKRVTAQRRFATQQYSLSALRELAHKANTSLNDIVLYLCSTAIRRFLKEQNALPSDSLTAGIPVNIRTADDAGTGTAISFIIATLATDIADPLRRLAVIKASTEKAKTHMQALPRSTLTQYTTLLMAPYMLQLISGLGGRGRPVFNITISNVPGPRETLYFEGAKLEAMYPVSLITHGGALNITCLSYADSLNFGYTGCRDTLPSMQRLAVYTGEALEELEQLLGDI